MKNLYLFVFRFALLFCLLTWPWPVLRQAVSACFRMETRFLVAVAYPGHTLNVQPLLDSRYPSLDTQVTGPELQEIRPDGRRWAMGIPFDSHSQGWVPLAMLMALVIATPLPWFKRVKVLLIGSVFIQILIAATILASVSFNLSSATSPSGENVLYMLANHLLVENIWFSFVPSFLLWLAWLACGQNWKQLGERLAAGSCPKFKSALF